MKKICSLIIALMLILQAGASVSFAQSKEVLPLIQVLGLMSEEDGDEFVTRGRFLSLVLQTLKMNFQGYSSEPVFSDLTVSHPYYGEIMYALKSGIVSGAGDGRFYPDDYITGEQAVIMMINAGGYRLAAQSAGYMPFAWKIGLTKDTKIGIDAPLTEEDARMLLINMLNAPYPETTIYTTAEEIIEMSRETYLNKIWGMFWHEGIIDGTMIRSTSLSPQRKGYVSINGVSYKSSENDMDKYFGMKVKFLCNDTSDEKELYFAYPVNNKKEKYTGLEFSSFDGKKIEFFTDEKISYTLNTKTTLIWNNKTVSSAFLSAKIKLCPGDFEVTDNNGDKIADVVAMYNPKVYFGGYIDSVRMIISDEEYSDIKLDDYENYIVYDANGKKLSFETLKDSWHYLVYDPEDASCALTIVAADTFFEDKVQAVAPEENEATLAISGEYKILSGSKASIEELKPGYAYNFYFDAQGRIIDAREKTGVNEKAVYLMGGDIKSHNSNVTVKFLDESGKISLASFAPNVSFRDKNGKTSRLKEKEAYEMLMSDGRLLPQLVFVRQNDEQEITSIIQVCEDTTKPFHIQKYEKTTDDEAYGRRWLKGAQSFSNEIQLKTATKVFVVPDRTLPLQDDQYYYVTATTMFNNNSDYTINEYPRPLSERYTSIPVVADKDGYAADYFVLECPKDTAFSSGIDSYGLVTDIRFVIDKESGEEHGEITLLNAISLQEERHVVEMSANKIFERYGREISRGDIIKIKAGQPVIRKQNLLLFYDRSENTHHFATCFDVGTGFSNEIGYRYYADFRVSVGQVDNIDNGVAVCTTSTSEPAVTHTEYIRYSSGKIMKFSQSKAQCEIYDAKYLKPGDKYIACMTQGTFKLIIFYE